MTVNQFLEKRNTSGESIWKRPIGTNCPLSLDEFDPANLGPDDIQKEVNLKQQVVLVCRNPNSEETERHYDLYDGVKFFKCLGLHELDECPSDSQRIQTYPWAATSSVKWPEKVNHPESRVSLTPENAFGMVDLMAVRTALPTPEPVALTEN